MAKRPILQEGDPMLRAKAAEVPASLFTTPELVAMIKDLTDTLDAEADGVAIAAPQVGIPYRIFLVRYDRMLPDPQEGEKRSADVGVFVNPEFVKQSKKGVRVDEGCLSVRNVYGKTGRKTRATVRALDERGAAFERGAGGLLAQAFQHEMDHLDGILFIDHATDLVEVKEEDRAEFRAKRRAKRAEAGQDTDE